MLYGWGHGIYKTSKAIFDHYIPLDRRSKSRGDAGQPEEAFCGARHGRVDMSRVRFIKLGTGTESQALKSPQGDALADYVPGFIRMTFFLKRTLKKTVASSEAIAGQMVTLAQISNEGSISDLNYYRFSADNGVCCIKIDEYKKLDRICELDDEVH